MAFLDRFKRQSVTPTQHWVEDRSVSLVADFDTFCLCGVALGDVVEGLGFLGPAVQAYDFPRKGLVLDVADSRLEGFCVALSDAATDLFPMNVQAISAFRGVIRAGGRDWHPRELAREADFRELWGEPYWRDVDDQEILLFFELRDREIQVELTLAGMPKALIIGKPLLADPDQRTAYGVTKPWPP
ncbi:MAG: hypothetical protein OER90_08700 [Gemmatimonadota bacterium]|nr:hypothetical protein [Gemmatimonadota bacterium]